jgi:hypothetical protein
MRAAVVVAIAMIGAADVSPRVMELSWGRLEVERPGSDGGTSRFKDAKLWPGGARVWDWRETGTEHDPGIQPADVEELLDHGATVIVLSRGMLGRLGVMPATLRLLESRGVRSEVAQTEEAVRLYNALREHERVAGLFHTTC